MFIVLLTFGAKKADAPRWMEDHKAWIAEGFESGMFHLLGSLVPAAGGAFIASANNRTDIEAFIARDPFVEHDVVEVTIHEFEPNRAAADWQHLLKSAA